jgi:DNA-binding transcriptional MerR regulator/trans-aconitate methyltransferase
MNEDGLYKSGEFAKKANVSIRTIRYYDKQGLLKPSYVNKSGYRFYNDLDFAKLQKIVSLKSLGFSLEEIMELVVRDNEHNYLLRSFQQQLELIRNKQEHLKLMEESLLSATKELGLNKQIGWEQVLHLIHLSNMEKEILNQYHNSSNTNIRISLHKTYSQNSQGWFPWLYSHYNLTPGETVLELGCGNGELWRTNQEKLPPNIKLLLTDQSSGMLKDAKTALANTRLNIQYRMFDCHKLPLKDCSMDKIIANHVMFYIKDRNSTFLEIKRALKKEGVFYCSTYGKEHMKEVNDLVKEFDSRIALSEINLYEIFGLENGAQQLSNVFADVHLDMYEDYLVVYEVQPLIDYILSCHGNQLTYLKHRYVEFKDFLNSKLRKHGSIKITKMAGMFICRN